MDNPGGGSTFLRLKESSGLKRRPILKKGWKKSLTHSAALTPGLQTGDSRKVDLKTWVVYNSKEVRKNCEALP